jgi:EmrB/QacA subfamily drug resistance transporter
MGSRPVTRARRRAVVAAVSLAAFATNLTLTILTIAVKPIAEAFDATASDAAWITIGPMVVTAVLTPAASRAADSYGRKRVWLIGFALAIAGIALSGWAWSLPVLIIARLLTGVGTSAVFPSGLAIAVSVYPPERRGVPVGLWTSVMAFSPALGVIVGGLAIDLLSWRWLFHAQLPLALVAFAIAVVVFDEQRDPEPARFDVGGAALVASIVLTLLLVLNRGPTWGWLSWPTVGCLGAAVAAWPVFLAVERRAAQPVLPLELFRDRAIRWAILSRSMLNGVYMGAFLILPLYLLGIAGWSPGVVALSLVPRPLAMGITGPLAGRLVRPSNAGVFAMLGSLLIVLPLAFFAFLQPDTPYPIMAVALVMQGTGLGLAQTSTGSIVAWRTRPEQLATASGVLSITSTLANSVGMALLLSLVVLGGGEQAAPAYRLAFGTAAALASVAMVAAAILARVLGEDRDPVAAHPSES